VRTVVVEIDRQSGPGDPERSKQFGGRWVWADAGERLGHPTEYQASALFGQTDGDDAFAGF
jgi:hypothetical protein